MPLPDVAGIDQQPRAQQQRDRILCAAKHCFISDGFHAASMSRIAETAGMSAGLIYRYFENKSAIVQAIIARQLEEHRNKMDTLQTERQLAERLRELFRAWREGDPSIMNAALFLEMTAESTRDERIESTLVNSDRINRENFVDWLRQRGQSRGEPQDESRLRARALAMCVFIEGLAVRAVREPHFDQQLLDEAIEMVLGPLLGTGTEAREKPAA
ncbi:MAG: TetR/AcrR family transcriptional regulator [Lysobacteraceae bacterium]